MLGSLHPFLPSSLAISPIANPSLSYLSFPPLAPPKSTTPSLAVPAPQPTIVPTIPLATLHAPNTCPTHPCLHWEQADVDGRWTLQRSALGPQRVHLPCGVASIFVGDIFHAMPLLIGSIVVVTCLKPALWCLTDAVAQFAGGYCMQHNFSFGQLTEFGTNFEMQSTWTRCGFFSFAESPAGPSPNAHSLLPRIRRTGAQYSNNTAKCIKTSAVVIVMFAAHQPCFLPRKERLRLPTNPLHAREKWLQYWLPSSRLTNSACCFSS